MPKPSSSCSARGGDHSALYKIMNSNHKKNQPGGWSKFSSVVRYYFPAIATASTPLNMPPTNITHMKTAKARMAVRQTLTSDFSSNIFDPCKNNCISLDAFPGCFMLKLVESQSTLSSFHAWLPCVFCMAKTRQGYIFNSMDVHNEQLARWGNHGGLNNEANFQGRAR